MAQRDERDSARAESRTVPNANTQREVRKQRDHEREEEERKKRDTERFEGEGGEGESRRRGDLGPADDSE